VAEVAAASGREKIEPMNTNGMRKRTRSAWVAAALAASFACATTAKLATFETPNQAMQALADVAGTHDTKRAEELLGEGGVDLLRSGDEVADHADAERVKQEIREKLAFEEPTAGTKVALLGKEAWPFPIPLVQEGGRWQFDVPAGLEEIENRRIGRNEISTIATLHEYVDAQREYASTERDGRPAAFARRVISTAGQHDGLFWPVAEGEPDSPLGPQIAAATEEGYTHKEGEERAFHGYLFRTLTSQGKHAPGGEKNFVDEKGVMSRGFAMIAWPTKHGNSGVMTFLVGPYGIVYQKDLGADTATAVARITTFDPDDSWDPTGD
jgi:hypothetical protein